VTDTEVHINIAVIVLFSDMSHIANIPTVQPPTALDQTNKQTNKELSAPNGDMWEIGRPARRCARWGRPYNSKTSTFRPLGLALHFM
jgi:hypothetical protein